MTTTQGVLTVAAEILPERVKTLAAHLKRLGAIVDGDAQRGPGAPKLDPSAFDTVHFARFVIIPEVKDDDPEPAAVKHELFFSTAFDGPRRFHLAELAMKGSEGLCEIFENCRDFPASARTAPATLIAFLEKHHHRHGAMHVGYVGRTVQDIQRERALRQFLESAVDRARKSGLFAGRSHQAIRQTLIGWVADSDFRWALEPRATPIARHVVEGFYRSYLTVGAVGSAALILLALIPISGITFGVPGFVASTLGLVAPVGLLYKALTDREETDPAKTDTDISEDGLTHAEDEDFGLRNQLTHIVDVKPGLFRRLLLRAVLAAVEFRARREFYQGDLAGIETIHCAHWVFLPGPPARLLFFSNYDGSWERYLGDFIEEAGGGMTAVWSNTVEFPRSKNLLDEGVTHERVFKAWTRDHQVRTLVWYAAAPDISIRNVNSNSRLRDGLGGYMNEEEAQAWLRLL